MILSFGLPIRLNSRFRALGEDEKKNSEGLYWNRLQIFKNFCGAENFCGMTFLRNRRIKYCEN